MACRPALFATYRAARRHRADVADDATESQHSGHSAPRGRIRRLRVARSTPAILDRELRADSARHRYPPQRRRADNAHPECRAPRAVADPAGAGLRAPASGARDRFPRTRGAPVRSPPAATTAMTAAIQRIRGSASIRFHKRSRKGESPKSCAARSISGGSPKRVVNPATARPATVKQASCARPMTPENRKVKYAMHVLATPVASVGQRCRAIARRLLVRAPMTQQVQRIILRDADQRESESERDAVHGAEQRADHGQAGEPRAGERQRH